MSAKIHNKTCTAYVKMELGMLYYKYWNITHGIRPCYIINIGILVKVLSPIKCSALLLQ